jgi:hypothetical protein
MSSLQQIIRRAKKAYRACAHVEQEWLANELGSDLDIIQDALGDIMYPEQFATPWEKSLYDALEELMADLDLKNFPRPHIEGLLKDFSKEQERRLEGRNQMEAFSKSN